MLGTGEIFYSCSPGRLYAVVSGLTVEKKEIIREMGFGSFVGMKKCNLRRDLICWLIERFDPAEGTLVIGNQNLTLNGKIFGKMLGVVDGGEDLGDLLMDEPCKRIIGDRISISRLQETLKKNENEHLFVKNFVQFLCSTVLLPSTSLYVLRSLEECLKDINVAKVARTKNWASISWRYLVEGVRRFKERRSQFVPGCVYFFQLFYLNHLEGHNRYVDKSVCPSNWWTEKEIRLVFDWIKELGGFDKVLVKSASSDDEGRVIPGNDNVSSHTSGFEDLLSEVRLMRSEFSNLRGELVDNVKEQGQKRCKEIIRDLSELYGKNNENVIVVDENIEERTNFDGLQNFLTNTTVTNTSKLLYKKFVDSGGRVVGPFTMSSSIDLSLFVIAMYIFQDDRSLSEVLYRHNTFEVVRLYFGTLLPHSKVDLQLVGAFVSMIRLEELTKFSLGTSCCVVTMPVRKRNGCIVDFHNICQGDDYIPLSKCAKVLVPILDFDEDHWFLAEFNKIENYCGIWDSVGPRIHKMTRWKLLHELASCIDREISSQNNCMGVNCGAFVSMNIKEFQHIHLQQNNRDCGVFVMKFIETCVSMEKVMHPFDPISQRMFIALRIVMSLSNELCTEVLGAARCNLLSISGGTSNGCLVSKPLARVFSPTHLLPVASLSTKKQRTALWSRGRRRARARVK